MTLRAASLNTRVTILKRADGQDDLGQPTEGWATAMTLWADVRHQTGLQRLSADALHDGARCSIRVRQTHCTKAITAGMRARVDTTEYTVLDAMPQGREAIDLVCEVRR